MSTFQTRAKEQQDSDSSVKLQKKESASKSADPSGTQDAASLQRATDRGAASPAALLHLQRSVGNRAMSNLLGRGEATSVAHLQAKLEVGGPNDQYEKEADSVADRVVGMSDEVAGEAEMAAGASDLQTKPIAASISPVVRRQEQVAEDELQKKAIQRQAVEDELQMKRVQRAEMEEELAQRKGQDEEELQAKPLQRAEMEEELAQPKQDEEELQAKPIQRAAMEEELAQPKQDEEELQAKPIQRVAMEEELAQPKQDEEGLQAKPIQRAAMEEELAQPKQDEEELQAKPIQRAAMEEELAQPKQDEEELQRAALEEEEQQVQKKSVEGPCAKCGKDEVQMKPIQRAPEQMDEEQLQKKALQRAPEQMNEEELQRQIQRLAEEEESLQKRSDAKGEGAEATRDDGSFEAGGAVEERLASERGRGEAMPDETRDFMESRFGADFSDVRIHRGGEAAELSQDLQAQAFTQGRDIFFNDGKFNPETAEGKHLLAHELTHVVQQGGQDRVQRKITKRQYQDQEIDSGKKATKGKYRVLDFIRFKHIESEDGERLMEKLTGERPNSEIRHWWMETGNLEVDGVTWLAEKSYGWWPGKGDKIETDDKDRMPAAIPGKLNRSESEDPHHKDDAEDDEQFHPMMEVDEDVDYQKFRQDLENKIKSFATSYVEKWQMNMSWYENSLRFHQEMMEKLELKEPEKDVEWLRNPKTLAKAEENN